MFGYRGKVWLKTSNKIKVLKGSGPYYTGESGEKQYLGNNGVFVVDSILGNGIMAVSQYGAIEFLYMGQEEKSNVLDNIIRSSYKIALISKG